MQSEETGNPDTASTEPSFDAVKTRYPQDITYSGSSSNDDSSDEDPSSAYRRHKTATNAPAVTPEKQLDAHYSGSSASSSDSETVAVHSVDKALASAQKQIEMEDRTGEELLLTSGSQERALDELNFRDAFDYAATHDVAILNQKLAEEATRTHKDSRVGFKEDVEYFEHDLSKIPPADEAEDDRSLERVPVPNDTEAEPVPPLVDSENDADEKFIEPYQTVDDDQNTDDLTPRPDDDSKSKHRSQAKMVVEVDGEIKMMTKEEMRSQGHVDLDEDSADEQEQQEGAPVKSEGFPSPDHDGNERERPTSAPEPREANRTPSPQDSPKPDRPQTAIPERNSSEPKHSDLYGYQDHKKVSRQMRIHEQNEQKRKKREQEEREEKKKQDEQLFKAWLENKQKQKDEAKEKQKREKQKTEQEEKKNKERSKRMTVEQWNEAKKEIDRSTRELMRLEKEEFFKVRSRRTKQENEEAFKRWIKEKRKQEQQRIRDEIRRARITRLAMRRCRKSQALAQAMQQANSFRYLEFFGY